jgi:hypothetical protein
MPGRRHPLPGAAGLHGHLYAEIPLDGTPATDGAHERVHGMACCFRHLHDETREQGPWFTCRSPHGIRTATLVRPIAFSLRADIPLCLAHKGTHQWFAAVLRWRTLPSRSITANGGERAFRAGSEVTSAGIRTARSRCLSGNGGGLRSHGHTCTEPCGASTS